VKSWLIVGRRQMPLMEGANLIGRAADAAIQIDSPGISRRHARLVVSAGEAALEDLGSKNGTYVNGRRITASCRVGDGDEIRLGATVLRFKISSPATPTATLLLP
jgi:pSer/pThr/pTyr-binding forkhead associated (FHA) protein